MSKLSTKEKQWQAEADADTMARYEEIMQDTSRRKAAISKAKERANELNKRAAAMNKVAGTKTTTKRNK